MGNFKSLNAKRVEQFIAWSRGKAPTWLKDHGFSGVPDSVHISYAAWQLLKTEVRGDEQNRYDNDYDAAAAEHYMYIRYLASATGDPYCHTAPTVYAAKKVIDQLLGRLQSGQAQSGHPVLPSNPFVLAWGQRGVSDGLNDYKRLNANAPYQFGKAIEPLARFSFSADNARKMGEYAQHPVEFVTNGKGKVQP